MGSSRALLASMGAAWERPRHLLAPSVGTCGALLAPIRSFGRSFWLPWPRLGHLVVLLGGLVARLSPNMPKTIKIHQTSGARERAKRAQRAKRKTRTTRDNSQDKQQGNPTKPSETRNRARPNETRRIPTTTLRNPTTCSETQRKPAKPNETRRNPTKPNNTHRNLAKPSET